MAFSQFARGTLMLTVHHLNESRSQRILWLLEELGTPYELKTYQRDAQTRLAPPELRAVSALGKSPVVTDGDRTIIETGAIIDYIIRRHGSGRMQPDPASADYDLYVQWLHYGEGSAMLPLMLQLYTARLKEAGAPLQPRIQSETANHLGFINAHLKDRSFFVGADLTGADVQMSFVAEVARAQGSLAAYPNFSAWLDRMHERPAWKRAIDKGGPYALGR
jgi:glutathione S-transferase